MKKRKDVVSIKEKKLLESIKTKPIYGKYDPDEIVICKICGAGLKRVSNTHLKFKHNISTEEYLKRFPDAQLYCNSAIKKMSESSSEIWKDPKYKKKMIKKLKIACNRPEEKERRSRVAKNLHNQKNSPYNAKWKENLSNSQKELWKDPNTRNKRIKKIHDFSKNPEFRKKLSDIRKRDWEDPNHVYNSDEYRKKHSNIQTKKMKQFKIRKQISNKLVTHGKGQQRKYKN